MGKPVDYLWTLGLVALCTLAGRLLVEVIALGNVALLYLVR